MANTTVNSQIVETKFLKEFQREYVRANRFARYTGTSNASVIYIKEGRQIINIPLVTRLKGAGVTGSTTLRGNGEKISNFGINLTPAYSRHAVEFDKEEMEKPAIDLMSAARPLLMDWAMEDTRDKEIEAFNAIDNGTTYANYGDAAAGAMDTWNTNNNDRILYGSAKSNNTSGDHTTSLGTIDTTNDKLTTSMVSLAKRMAQNADRHIRPLKAEEDDEKFVMFCDQYAFRDLKEDPTLTQAQREALKRGAPGHPLFTGGDLLWDNVIIREIPEVAIFIDGSSGTNGVWGGNSTADGLNTAGAGSSRVGVSFLCGQTAIGFGLGQRPQIITDKLFDYGFQPGVAVELKDDIKKSFWNNIQNGSLTIFSSSAADV